MPPARIPCGRPRFRAGTKPGSLAAHTARPVRGPALRAVRGNAPTLMVYAIAKAMGVKMPSFFGTMLWSGAILIPIFVLVTVVFFG
jgi:Na+/H+ antiporter NhaD/arsenite permease-like protein